MKNFTGFRFTLLLLFSFISTFSHAQQGENYSKIYTTANGMNATAILKTREDKLVMTAKDHLGSKVIFQTNLLGELEWSYQFSDPTNFQIDDIQETEDGNYLLTGIQIQGQINSIITIKLNPNGEVIWSKKMILNQESIGAIAARSKSLSDSSSLIYCSSKATGRTILYKVNKNGDAEWNTVIRHEHKMQITDLILSEQNQIYICGYLESTPNLINYTIRGYLIKLDIWGEFQWGRSYQHELFESLALINDEILILGNKYYGLNQIHLYKFNLLGENLSVVSCNNPYVNSTNFYKFDKLKKIDDENWSAYICSENSDEANLGFSFSSNGEFNHFIEDNMRTGIDQIYLDTSTIIRIGNPAGLKKHIQLLRFSTSNQICTVEESNVTIQQREQLNGEAIDSISISSYISLEDYNIIRTTITIEVQETCELTTASLSNQELQKLKLYPNPMEDVLYIENPTSEPRFIKIQNNLGQLIDQFTAVPQTKSQVNTQNLNSGFYTITCENGERYSVVKF